MSVQSVMAMAPLRMSYLGGGTDFESYYSTFGGQVISAAINKYVYVHIKKHNQLFQEKYRVSYSTVESCNDRSEIKNYIVRSCLEFLNVDEPLQISISSDLPSNSGLGSSSSFTVALLLAIHSLNEEEASPAQIAQEACEVEIKLMGSPIGKQDQYAAAFGGLNRYEFLPNGKIRIEPIVLPHEELKRITGNSALIWTGISREANNILADQEIRNKDGQNIKYLNELNSLTSQLHNELCNSSIDLVSISNLITQGWKLKQNLSVNILDENIILMIDKIKDLNPIGIKLLGAGGGGFILAIFDDMQQGNMSNLNEFRWFSPEIDFGGARIVSKN